MKKHLLKIFSLGLLLAFAFSYARAQGGTCVDPIVISSLPYSTTDNTSNYGSNYTGVDRPPLGGEQVANGTGSDSYLNGDDAVYSFTPSNSGCFNIKLSNTLDDWIGF